jgi:CubicO group peptidase (beta-lactamase class C family)
MPDAFEQVDAIFERVVEAEHVPGVAYGIVIGGELVHARGLGTAHAGDDAATTPEADSVFRIASMTKSFTAATTLLLRDEGALRLDEPVGTYVPELDGFKGPMGDSPLITVRHLLTMSGGLPTDDPWGDRLQGMALDRFAELLRGGFEFAWTPGTAFEYSNLGYGILGRVLTNVSGIEYRDLVRERLLEPLGMSATTYDADDVPTERLVQGHVHRDDAFIDEPFDGYGALASMGGVFTSVRDLATWVDGFADAFPPRDDPQGAHPLSRASRREMQQVQRAFDPELTWTDAAAQPTLEAGGYGFGLFVKHDLELGHVVAHSGGYPGFGSHMRWHPASGVGVIGLGNRTYAPMMGPCTDALVALATAKVAPVRKVVPWDATEAARADVERLLDAWHDDLASRLFAFNVDMDEPLERRRAELERTRERFGPFTRDDATHAESDAPVHLIWWMQGERGGRVRLEIQLTPERSPRVQSLDLREVPATPPELRALAERVATLLSGDPTAWPDDLRPADADEAAGETADRSLRAAAAIFGPVSVGEPTQGDGRTTSAFPLRGDRGALTVKITIDPDARSVTELSLRPDDRKPPISG